MTIVFQHSAIMELRQKPRNKRLSRKASELPLWKVSLNKPSRNEQTEKPSKTSARKKHKSAEKTKAPITPSQKKKKTTKNSKEGLQKNSEKISRKVSSSVIMKDKKSSILASGSGLESNSKSSRGQSTICTICKKKFARKNLLKKHITKHHFFRHCPNCPKTFQQTRKFILHLRSHLLDHPYECKICLESYNQKKDMLAHRVGHKSRMLSCEICSKICPHLASLNRHRLAHSGPPYPCEDCNAIFSNVPDRTVHSKNHVHRCILCPKKVVAFPTNADLAVHMYKSHRTENYDPTKFNAMDANEPCVSTGAVQLEDDGESDSMDDLSSSDCESDADLDDNYQKDAVESVYNLKRKDKFMCFICYDLYPSCALLKSHMKAHNWFPCNSCPKFFPDTDELKKHKCDSADELLGSSRCLICNSECENCKKKCRTVNSISKAGMNVSQSFQDLPSFGVTDYTDVAQRNYLINFIDYLKCNEVPLNVKSFTFVGFHYGNLQLIMNNPAVNCLFPREYICDLEELHSKFQNLIEILLERNNCFSA